MSSISERIKTLVVRYRQIDEQIEELRIQVAELMRREALSNNSPYYSDSDTSEES